jgi:hypothetical protein
VKHGRVHSPHDFRSVRRLAEVNSSADSTHV